MRTVKNLMRRGKNICVHEWIQWHNPDVTLEPPIVWRFDSLDAIQLGPGSRIAPFSEVCALRHAPFSAVEGGLEIGPRTAIGVGGNLRAVGGKITIGSHCLIAQHVTMSASNHQFHLGRIYMDLPWDESRTGVTIGDNCWLGAGVIVLPGVSIRGQFGDCRGKRRCFEHSQQ